METTTRLTAEDLLRMPDDDMRHELVRGELRTTMPPGFRHGFIVLRLAARLLAYVEDRDLGIVTDYAGFVLARGPDTVRGPDATFVSKDRLPSGQLPPGYFEGAPDLAIEVLSPSNRLREIEEKIEEYFGAGGRLVWVVNPRKRIVTVRAPGRPPRVLREQDTLDGEDVVPGFRYDLTRLWR